MLHSHTNVGYAVLNVVMWAAMQYSVLQCVAVCCSVLQCVAVCCSVLQRIACRCQKRHCRNRRLCSTQARSYVHDCITLHHTAPHCTTLHHTTPHCTTLHHTASHYIILHARSLDHHSFHRSAHALHRHPPRHSAHSHGL